MTHSIEPSGTFGGDSPFGGTQSRWWWRLEDASGGEVTGLERPEFPSQSDAESWVGEMWQDLLEDGVDAVRLFEGEREVYGPMSLHSS